MIGAGPEPTSERDGAGSVHASNVPGGTRLSRWLRGRSLAACVDGGRDNILHLRLLAALMVVFGHSVLAGPGGAAYQRIREFLPGVPIHEAGLFVFFTISGFLITLSFERRPDLLRFLRARALRLLPALAVCVFAWAFVLGPLLSTLPLREYFAVTTADGPWAYALGTVSLLRVGDQLPGVFERAPVLHSVNSSLWSIPVEAKMYLCVAAAGVCGLLRRRWLAAALIALACAAFVAWPLASAAAAKPPLAVVVQGFFGAGAITCLLRRHVPVSTPLMLAVALACVAASHTRYAMPFSWLATGYFVFWFSYVPRGPAMPRGLDVSYGVYLWGWPTQQTLALAGIRSPLVLFALVSPLLMAIGALSWLRVEQPALRWKSRRGARVVPVGQSPA